MSLVEHVNRIVEEHRDEIIAFTQAVVATPSITRNELDCARVIRAKMEELGLQVQWLEPEPDRPDLVATLPPAAQGGKTLIFNGHIDVVPPGPPEEWEMDPFSGAIKDGRLYGRGAVDMKAGLTCMIMATGLLAHLPDRGPGVVQVHAVSDEQISSTLGTVWLCEQGYVKADFAISGEPTNFDRVDMAHRGSTWIEVTTWGRSIHGARPWLGVNAIDHMRLVMNELETYKQELVARKHPLVTHPTINISMIDGGTVENMVPARCRMVIDRRLIPGETRETAMAEITAILERVKSRTPEFRYELRSTKYKPPMEIDRAELVVDALVQSVGDVLGRPPEVLGKDAGTDATWIVNLTGTPCPVWGPGDYLRYSLGPNENVPVEDLVGATKVYMLAAARCLGWERS